MHLEEGQICLGFSFAVGPQLTPSSNGAPSVPPSLTLLLPLPSEWLSTLGNISPSFFFCIYLQLQGAASFTAKCHSLYIYLLKACHAPGETRDMGNISDQTQEVLWSRTSQSAKKGRQEKAQGINRTPGKRGNLGMGAPPRLCLLTMSVLGQGSGSQLAYFPHLRKHALHK